MLLTSPPSSETPLRAKVSDKLCSEYEAVQVIIRHIVSSNCGSHVIYGPRGVGKSWTAHIVAQLPLCKSHFSDGVIWLDLGMCRNVNFTLMRTIYESICTRLDLDIKPRLDKVLYAEISGPNVKGEDYKNREKDAMIEMRDIMSRCILDKNMLLCVDGLSNLDDIVYFDFHHSTTRDDIVKNSRLLVTTSDSPDGKSENIKLWHLNNYNSQAAKPFFLNSLLPSTTSKKVFLEKYDKIYQICQGNPLSLKALSHLVDDKIQSENYKSLDEFVLKFENAPREPKIQTFSILEALFTHSSLGPSFNKITWRCFAGFAVVFKHDDCKRASVGRSPTKVLFSAIIKKIAKDTSDSERNVESHVDKVIDFFVKNKVFIQIDGFDEGSTPRTFYQISCQIYQEFGEHLSSTPQTNMKLHQLFINEYATMFSHGHAAFGYEIDHFMLKWLPCHLREVGDFKDEALTLQDHRFIQERIKYMGIIKAVKRHIYDTESCIRMSKSGSHVLLPSYEAFTMILESQIDDKENGTKYQGNLKETIEAMWDMAMSLFSHYYVKEGCELVQKAIGYDDEVNPSIDINNGIFFLLAESSSKDDHLKTVRSLIKIGAEIARSNKRQFATNIMFLGLKGLTHYLGYHSLQVARAHVFIGEVLYRDLKLYEDAIDQLKVCLPLLVKELGEESGEVYDAIILCGKTYIELGQLDIALQILEKIAPQVKEGHSIVDARFHIASIYLMKGDPTTAHSIVLPLRRKTTDSTLLKKIDDMIEECSNCERHTI